MTENSIEIQPQAVKILLEAGTDFLFVDVREPEELMLAKLKETLNIPLRFLPENIEDLRSNSFVVFMCHGGVRSMNAAMWARKHGIEGALSMRGGIEAWALEVDTSIPRY
jgi:rhodanese-related sulfurtransferase